MKTLTKIILVVFFLFSVLCSLYSVANAEVPHLINYQGRLTDSSGKPLEGTHNLTFRIYDAETAGNLLWQETQSVLIQKGIFSVLLGGVTNLDLSFDKPYWLEIKVNNEVMSQRQRITSVGYAIRAEKAEEVKGITNFFPASGNVGIGTASPADKLDVAGAIAINSKRIIDSSGNWVGNPTNLVGPAGPQGPTGPQGIQGPQGPPGPAVNTSAVCVNGGSGNCSSICQGQDKVVAHAYGSCTATSDTGSCSPVLQPGTCCVCKP
jgi:hypothetical protein